MREVEQKFSEKRWSSREKEQMRWSWTFLIILEKI